MIARLPKVWGSVCDRCSYPYLTAQFPNPGLCPHCYVGALSGAEQGRILATTGRTTA